MLYEILVCAAVMTALVGTTSIVLELIRRRSGLSKSDTTALEEIRARLTRIEQVTDVTAIEVERIGEGQRFTTKLLSEKNTSADK